MSERLVLSPEQKGEIALRLIQYRTAQKGIHLSVQKNRDIANMAKNMGISVDDAKLFLSKLMLRILAIMFPHTRRMFAMVLLSRKKERIIAMKFFEYLVAKDDIHITKETLRELKDVSEKIQIPTQELYAFIEEVVENNVKNILSSLKNSDKVETAVSSKGN